LNLLNFREVSFVNKFQTRRAASMDYTLCCYACSSKILRPRGSVDLDTWPLDQSLFAAATLVRVQGTWYILTSWP